MRPVLRAIPHPMMTDWDMPDCHDAADNLYNPLVRCRPPRTKRWVVPCALTRSRCVDALRSPSSAWSNRCPPPRPRRSRPPARRTSATSTWPRWRRPSRTTSRASVSWRPTGRRRQKKTARTGTSRATAQPSSWTLRMRQPKARPLARTAQSPPTWTSFRTRAPAPGCSKQTAAARCRSPSMPSWARPTSICRSPSAPAHRACCRSCPSGSVGQGPPSSWPRAHRTRTAVRITHAST